MGSINEEQRSAGLSVTSFRSVFSDTLIRNMIGAIIGVFVAILLARGLGPGARGEMAVVITSVIITSIFACLYQGGHEILIGEQFSRLPVLMFITLVGSIVLSGTFYLLCGIKPVADILLANSHGSTRFVFSLLLALTVIQIGLQRVLTARQEFIFINRVDMICSILYCILLLIGFYFYEIRVLWVLIILGFIYFVKTATFSWKINLEYSEYMKEYSSIDTHIGQVSDWSYKEIFRISGRNFLFGTPEIITLRANIWQMATLSSVQAAGILRIAMSFMDFFNMVPNMISTIIRGKAVSEEGGWERAALAAKLVFLSGLLTTILFGATGWYVVPLAFGKDFAAAYPVAILIIFAASLWAYADILFVQVNAKKRYPWIVVLSANGAMAVLLILNTILIPTIGIISAGISFIVVAVMMAVMSIWCFNRYGGLPLRNCIVFTANDRQVLGGLIKSLRKNSGFWRPKEIT